MKIFGELFFSEDEKRNEKFVKHQLSNAFNGSVETWIGLSPNQVIDIRFKNPIEINGNPNLIWNKAISAIKKIGVEGNPYKLEYKRSAGGLVYQSADGKINGFLLSSRNESTNGWVRAKVICFYDLFVREGIITENRKEELLQEFEKALNIPVAPSVINSLSI